MGRNFAFCFYDLSLPHPTMGTKSIQLVAQCILPGLTPHYVEFPKESTMRKTSCGRRITVVSSDNVLQKGSIAAETSQVAVVLPVFHLRGKSIASRQNYYGGFARSLHRRESTASKNFPVINTYTQHKNRAEIIMQVQVSL